MGRSRPSFFFLRVHLQNETENCLLGSFEPDLSLRRTCLPAARRTAHPIGHGDKHARGVDVPALTQAGELGVRVKIGHFVNMSTCQHKTLCQLKTLWR